MVHDETMLEMLHRHIADGEQHVLRQRDLLRHLEASQSPLIQEARDLLIQFESSLRDHQHHLSKVEEEQRAGLRDAAGALLLDTSGRHLGGS